MNRATVLMLIGLLLLSLLLAGCGTGGATYYGAYYGPPHSYGYFDRGYPVYIGIPDPEPLPPDLGDPVAVPLPMDFD
jgi:hypothetical protein